MDADRIIRILDAKVRVEEALTTYGVTVDANMRETIGWQMSALVDNTGLTINEAVRRIIADHIEPRRKAA